MMKFILKIACVGLMFGNFMFADFEAFKKYLKKPPSEDFFVIAVTRYSNISLNGLRPVEIDFLKLLLSQLINEPMPENQYITRLKQSFEAENKIETDEDVPGYLKSLWRYRSFEISKEEDMKEYLSILEACNFLNAESRIKYKPHWCPSILSIYRTDNEGSKLSFSVTENDGFSIENLKNASGLIAFNEYFFGKEPFPHEIAENYAKMFSEINAHYLTACNFLTYTKEFKPEQVERNINTFNTTQEGTARTTTNRNLTKELNSEFMLENKTFYTLQAGEQGKPTVVSTYNKSSYFNEGDDFLENQKAFYYFGDCNDHPCGTPLLFTVHSDISTEICRDVSIGLRKSDPLTTLHLIQSNTLKSLVPYGGNLPSSWCYIFCDPCVAQRNIIERTLGKYSHVYFRNANWLIPQSPCYSCSFSLHGCIYDVNIYKLEQRLMKIYNKTY